MVPRSPKRLTGWLLMTSQRMKSDLSGVNLDDGSFLHPYPSKRRYAILKAAGVKKIDKDEKRQLHELRTSREDCGCDCQGFCEPETCSCSLGRDQMSGERFSPDRLPLEYAIPRLWQIFTDIIPEAQTVQNNARNIKVMGLYMNWPNLPNEYYVFVCVIIYIYIYIFMLYVYVYVCMYCMYACVGCIKMTVKTFLSCSWKFTEINYTLIYIKIQNTYKL